MPWRRLLAILGISNIGEIIGFETALKYTFEANWDSWDSDGGSYPFFDPPPAGQGLPHFGLLTKIEDRVGNRAEMEYCAVWRITDPCMNPQLDKTYPETCQQRGQLKRVKLFSADSPNDPVWSIVYSHQSDTTQLGLGDCTGMGCFPKAAYDSPRMVRAIHVFDRDVSELDDVSCLTVPVDSFCSTNSLDDWDNTDYGPVPDDWVIEAEYTYLHHFANGTEYDPILSVDLNKSSSNVSRVKLIRSTVRTRESVDAAIQERTTLYRYNGQALKGIFEPRSVDSIVDALNTIGSNGAQNVNSSYIMSLDDDELVWFRDPASGAVVQRVLNGVASYWFESKPSIDGYDHLGNATSDFFADLANTFGNGEAWDTLMYFGAASGVANHITVRTGQSGIDGIYRVYPLRVSVPFDGCAVGDVNYDGSSHPWEGHIPFYMDDGGDCEFSGTGNTYYDNLIPPAHLRRHVTIVDQIDEGAAYSTSTNNLDGLLTRRVVDMNAQGFILRDRTFEFNSNGTSTVQQQGYAEERRYNTAGRITEIRSAGWSSEENENFRDVEGLIYFFEYGSNGESELSAEGVMIGTSGTKYYTAKYERDTGVDISSLPAHLQDRFGRRDLLTKVVQYRTPVTSSGLASATDVEVTLINYDFASAPVYNPPVVFEEQVTKIGSTTDAGVPIWSIERKKFDDSGNQIWHGVGRFATTNGEPERPAYSDMMEFFVDHSMYNSNGQLLRTVMDIDSTGAPTEFQRKADPLLTPLELEATFTYDVHSRPLLINKPTGRSDVFVYDVESATTNGILETWKYEDVLLGTGGGNFAVSKPVTIIQTTRQGRLHATITANLTSVDTTPDGNESYDVITIARMQYDEFGRPVGVAAPPDPDTPTDSLESKITYDAFGQVGRSQAPDGTVTRTIRGMRGRVQKIYRGTDDIHPYWRTAVYCDPSDPECEYPNGYPDNMVLVEKRFYGEGTNNAGRVKEIREYNQKPINQYFFTDPQDPNVPVNDENSNGLPTVFKYDCRMRQVFAEQQDEQFNPISNAFTWYDHLDRVRFVAEYAPGEGPPTTLDPQFQCYMMTDGGFGDTLPEPDVPTAADIVGAATAPLSLRETIYNTAGQIAEERDYRVSPATPLKYTATFYEFDGRSLTVSQQTPGGGTIKSLYDALGRMAVQRTIANDVELRRLENTYDAVGDLTQEVTYERLPEVTGDMLTSANAVIRYRHNWYDEGRRLIATADYGANNSADIFANGTAPTYNANSPPTTVTSLGDALVTLFEYDEAGRQYRVTDPGGIVTETEFDALGRVLLVTENSGGAAAEKQHTAYKYEAKTGRLTEVAAVKPAHFSGAPSFDGVNFGASDGSVQVTRYDYNGPVVNIDSNGAYMHVSTNGAWISAIHYPDEVTGQPEVDPSLRFTYRHDGQVVQRIDGRGVELVYRYDARDRLESITVAAAPTTVDTNGEAQCDPNDLACNPVPVNPSLNNPSDSYVDTSAFKLVYAYEPTGELATATVKNRDGQTTNAIDFDYGGFRQVEGVTQTVTGGTARFTDYNWKVKPNRYRLLNMAYPIGGGTTIKFQYGDTVLNPTDQPIDDELDRLTAIEAADGAKYVRYRYMGDGRMVGQYLGLVWQDYDGGIGSGGDVTGLDRFGRITDITYQNNTEQILAYAYGYDRRGNRTYARVENPTEDDSSWLYGYDDLSRLIRASKGILNAAGDALTGAGETLLWDLDILGNFSGDSSGQASFHRFNDLDGDGVFDAGESTLETMHHETDASNEIDRVLSVDITSNASTQGFYYDDAGNLLFDGKRFYTYDAFNRLVRIHETGTVQITSNGPEGAAGKAVTEFQYDALGRKVRTIHRPGEAGRQVIEHVYGSGAEVLAEYDVTASTSGTLLRWFIHGQSFPDPLVMVDLTNAGMESSGTEENFYYLKDALGSVGALADDYGNVVERYAYDPYGATVVLDANGALTESSFGSVAKPVDESSSVFYHDRDGDGDIDLADETDLLDCATNSFDYNCVYHHDRDGDRRVDIIDAGVFYGFEDYAPAGVPGPDIFGRPAATSHDWDGDGRVDLYDFAVFQACEGSSSDPCRLIFDANADGSVTHADINGFAAAQTSPGPPNWRETINASQYGNPFAFTGQRYDPLAGMYHFWARTYDPITSRWLQRDMMGPLAYYDISLSVNGYSPFVSASVVSASEEYRDGFFLYAYAQMQPTYFHDPLGLFSYLDVAGVQGESAYIRGATTVGGNAVKTLAGRVAGGLLANSQLLSVEILMAGAAMGYIDPSVAAAQIQETYAYFSEAAYNSYNAVAEGFEAYFQENASQGGYGEFTPRPPKKISFQKQARHAKDWANGISKKEIERLVQEAYNFGKPFKDQATKLVYETGKVIGKNGETRILVHVAKKNIHGHPTTGF